MVVALPPAALDVLAGAAEVVAALVGLEAFVVAGAEVVA